MAEFLGYPIEGNAISGNEKIYTNELWEPEQDGVPGSDVYFTHLMKGVTNDAKEGIKHDGGFKGNYKKYGEDEDGEDLSGRFSWWSVYIDDDNASRIKEEMDADQEPADIYMKGSRYGTNLFVEELDALILLYEESIQGPSEIRVLATFEYKREVQHALVVVPKNDITFETHQLVAERDDDGSYSWNTVHIVECADDAGYVWYPFSTVKWVNMACPPKERKWAHLAFAFYLDPIPDQMMLVPEVNNDYKWIKCNVQGFDLTTVLTD